MVVPADEEMSTFWIDEEDVKFGKYFVGISIEYSINNKVMKMGKIWEVRDEAVQDVEMWIDDVDD